MRARNPGTFRRARASIARRARAARACAEGCAAIRFRDTRARDDVAARRGVRRVGLVGRVFMWILEQRYGADAPAFAASTPVTSRFRR